MRRIVLFAGAVALIVGVIGLLTPLSVSPELKTVRCGSAVSSDLSGARAEDDGNAENTRVRGELVVDTNYTRLCEMELADRRAGAITLSAVGASAVVGAVVIGALLNRRKRQADS